MKLHITDSFAFVSFFLTITLL